MKVNNFSWECEFFFSKTVQNFYFEEIYATKAVDYSSRSIEKIFVSANFLHFNTLRRLESVVVMNSLCGSFPCVVSNSGRFKEKNAFSKTSLQRSKLRKFYYFFVSTLKPLLVSKQLPYSSTIDAHGQLLKQFSEFNSYLRIGTSKFVYDWDHPIQLIFQSFSSSARNKSVFRYSYLGLC